MLLLYYTRLILYYTILYTIYYILYTIYYLLSTIYYILYYTILYYTILYYTILYYTILYYTILYYTILYYTILYYTIYYTILHCTDVCRGPKRRPKQMDPTQMVSESPCLGTQSPEPQCRICMFLCGPWGPYVWCGTGFHTARVSQSRDPRTASSYLGSAFHFGLSGH